MSYVKQYLIALVLLIIMQNFSILEAAIRDGEKLTFTVNYGVVSAAEATLEIKSSKLYETPVWLITSNARTYPFFDKIFKVRDKVESWWDKDKLRSLRFSKRLNEGTYRQYRVHYYDHANKSSTYQKWNFKKQNYSTKQVVIPEGTQDILSAFYWTRQQKLTPGKTLSIDVTTDGQTYKTLVLVHRREKIDSIFGQKDCLVIEPKLKGEAVFKQSGRILIWVTDDEYKIPLKMTSQITFGAFTATLKAAENVPFKLNN
jgi:hypothetical protein